MKRVIEFAIFVIILYNMIMFSGCGGSGGGGSWHITEGGDTLDISFEFPSENMSYTDYFNYGNVIIALPNADYNDTLYYLLRATITGNDSGLEDINLDETKWITTGLTYYERNMKIVEGQSFYNDWDPYRIIFEDTLKIVRLDGSIGISSSGGYFNSIIDSAFSFVVVLNDNRVVIKDHKRNPRGIYKKPFNLSFTKKMRLEITYTGGFIGIISHYITIDDIFSEVKSLFNGVQNVTIETSLPDSIDDEPPQEDPSGYELLLYSEDHNYSAWRFKYFNDTTDEYSLHVILHLTGAGAGAVGGCSYSGYGNYRYYCYGVDYYNDPVFVNNNTIYNLICEDPAYYDSISGYLDTTKFMSDYKKVLGMLIAHELGHAAGNLEDNYTDEDNIMYIETNSNKIKLMSTYIGRSFNWDQEDSISRYSQFYFRRF